MTLSGLQHIHIRQSGRRFLKILFSSLLLVVFLSGCASILFVFAGRGDWSIELQDGYCINRINSREILVCHKEDPKDTGSSIIIPKFFVIAYALHDQYITFEGIKTQGLIVSDEELERNALCYFILNTSDGNLEGPFASKIDYFNFCDSYSIKTPSTWLQLKPDGGTVTKGHGDGLREP